MSGSCWRWRFGRGRGDPLSQTKRGPARTQTIRTLAGPLTASSLSAATRPPTPRKLAQQQGLAPRSDTADGRRSDMRHRTSRGQLTSVRSRLDNFGEMLSVGLQRQAEGTGEVGDNVILPDEGQQFDQLCRTPTGLQLSP